MQGPGERRKRLDQVLADYRAAAESGSAPTLEELKAAHPDLGAELGAALQRTTVVDPSSAATVHSDTGPIDLRLPDSAAQLGDYELVEELARGGMGVVFRARQKSLNRDVALKMILSGQFAGEEELRRFHAEAEAAAGLDHPNIVPIYEVGDLDGYHYFTMKLIEGGNLSGVSEDLSKDPRATAALMETVARAVHFAHQRGVLHRDLKPANILLDADGNPYVADFGLAKVLERDVDQSDGGGVIGTPSYMAPEQASGGSAEVTTASDVWGLGAILYEILVGRPPFREFSAHATVEAVLHEEPDPISKFRPGIPRDLESVCLKCLEKDPALRYPSAHALADDLARFLAGEPVIARPIGRSRRLLKWMRRRPAVAALLGLATLTVILVVAGSAALASEKHRAYLEEQALREKAELSKVLARRSLASAEDLLDFMLFDLRARLEDIGRLDLLEEVARKAESFYRTLGSVDTTEVDAEVSAYRRAVVLSDLGDLLAARNQLPAALEFFRGSLGLLALLADLHPGEPARRRDLALLHDKVGKVLVGQNRPTEAMVELRAALALREAIQAEGKGDRELELALATSHDNLARAELVAGDVFATVTSFRESLSRLERVDAAEGGSDPHLGLSIARAHERVGLALLSIGDLPASEVEMQRCQESLERLADAETESQETRHRLLAEALEQKGYLAMLRGEAEPALEAYREARAHRLRLSELDPTSAGRLRGLSLCHVLVGNALRKLNRSEEALDSYDKGLRISERLAALDPRNVLRQNDLAAVHFAIGRVRLIEGDLPAALAEYEISRSYREKLVEQDPTNLRWLYEHAMVLYFRGMLLDAMGERERGLESHQAALDAFERVGEGKPRSSAWTAPPAMMRVVIGDLYRRAGENAKASEQFEAALSAFDELSEYQKDNVLVIGFIAWVSLRHAQVQDTSTPAGAEAAQQSFARAFAMQSRMQGKVDLIRLASMVEDGDWLQHAAALIETSQELRQLERLGRYD